MALAPISQISNPFESYPGYWLKGYKQGTTTPILMSTDSSGLTTVAKAEISAGGIVPIGFITLILMKLMIFGYSPPRPKQTLTIQITPFKWPMIWVSLPTLIVIFSPLALKA
jgi:hypothetical protein